MNKYYTPDIEEFHVGFEYEYLDHVDFDEGWDEWREGTFKDGESLEWHDEYRAKCLDHEDVTSLGWEQTSYDQFKKDVYHLEIGEDNKLHIHSFIRERAYVLFNGTVKNKSELIKLLKMLGIC